MKEYPIEKAYKHDTILFKKQDHLKIRVTIYAPANVYFVVKRDGNTFYYYVKIDENSSDTRIIAHHLPDREFDWDNNGTIITTKVIGLPPENEELSSNARHTDNAIPY
ncbi:MAG: hypothetical protein K8R74_04510 [Bacteroidales bacterium]|nr:hypothetical protein [Bacteroidales bacterium]